MLVNCLNVNHVCKSYGVHKILKDVSICFYSGEVHALLGENASGKSTLVKVISGLEKANSGSITFNGKNFDGQTKKDCVIETVYQEVNLFDNLTVEENIYFKHFPHRLDYRKLAKKYEKDAKLLNLSCSHNELVGHLSLGQKRLIEITKALVSNPDILILDEPIESITQVETEQLINTIHELKEQGKLIIIVTHKLEQVLKLCDKVTILHDGSVVNTLNTENTDELSLLKMMSGNEFKNRYPRILRTKGEPILKVEHLGSDMVSDISFTLYQREILGITGLVGSGKSNLGKMIYGLDTIKNGKIYLKQKEIKKISPRNMLRGGCGFLVEESLKNLIPYLNAPKNITLSNIDRIVKHGLIQLAVENSIVKLFTKTFSMIIPNPNMPVKFLSGGTQQKIAISKFLNSNVDIMMVDEPTKGLDSASKSDVYNFMNEYVSKNKAMIIFSSDFAEVSGMCDRVIVLKDGKISCFLNRDELSKSRIILSATIQQPKTEAAIDS